MKILKKIYNKIILDSNKVSQNNNKIYYNIYPK